MSKFLFNEFVGTSSAAWKQKIQADLKGADYNETLLWKTNEGITVKPFYAKEDRTNTPDIFFVVGTLGLSTLLLLFIIGCGIEQPIIISLFA